MKIENQNMPIGKNLTVRPILESDASGPYCDWINDPDKNRWLSVKFDRKQTPADLVSYIHHCEQSSTELFLAIIKTDNQHHIGNLKLLNFDFPHRCCSLSLVLGYESEPGFGQETIALGLSLAFDFYHMRRVEAGGMAPNLRAQNAFLRCGFKEEGYSRSRYLVENIEYDCWNVGILKNDDAIWRNRLISNEFRGVAQKQ